MNEQKLAQLKRKIKHRTPEIIVALSALAGTAAIVYIAKATKVEVVPVFQLDLPKSTINHMIEAKQDLYFETDTLNLLVHLTDN